MIFILILLIILFDFSRVALLFVVLVFATASQLGAKRMQGKCVEDELLSLFA